METSTSSDVREERGRQLARMGTIRKTGRRWAVPSQTRPAERYLVDVEGAACTCPDYELRRGTCKHQHAVLFWIAWGRDVDSDGNVTETVVVKGFGDFPRLAANCYSGISQKYSAAAF